MKIVYLSTSPIPSRAANSVHVMKMCQAMAKNDHDVTLVYPHKKQEMEKNVADIFRYYDVEKCFKTMRFPWPSWPGRTLIFSAISALYARLSKPDVAFGRNLYACYFSALLGLSVIFESHSVISDSGPRAEQIFKKLIAHKNFKALVVITDALKRDHIEKYPSVESKIIVAADGADPIKDNVPPCPLRYGAASLQIGYAGNLYKGRGIEIIAESARRLPDMNFHIIGGKDSDIARCRHDYGAIHNLYFHGHQPPSMVPSILLSFDVLLAPYQNVVTVHGGGGDISQWMSPLKIFEYMSAGRAIIASDLPVLREVLVEGKNAIFAKSDNVDEWLHALLKLRDDPVLRQQLGITARTIFLERYTWFARAKKITDFFESLR